METLQTFRRAFFLNALILSTALATSPVKTAPVPLVTEPFTVSGKNGAMNVAADGSVQDATGKPLFKFERNELKDPSGSVVVWVKADGTLEGARMKSGKARFTVADELVLENGTKVALHADGSFTSQAKGQKMATPIEGVTTKNALKSRRAAVLLYALFAADGYTAVKVTSQPDPNNKTVDVVPMKQE